MTYSNDSTYTGYYKENTQLNKQTKSQKGQTCSLLTLQVILK